MLDASSLKTLTLPGIITVLGVEEKTVCPMTKPLMNDRELSAGQEITSMRQMREVIAWQW